MKINNSYNIKILMLLASFLGYFLIVVFPATDDFGFGNIAHVAYNEKTSTIVSTNIVGFDLWCMHASEILDLPYVMILIMPFLALPFIFSLLLFFRPLKSSWLGFAVLFLYLASDTNPVLVWSPHTMGLIFSLLVLYLSIDRSKGEITKNIPSLVVILILVIATNLCSYKYTFVLIMFMISIFLIHVIENFLILRYGPINKLYLMVLSAALMITLSFNQFFYDIFLPILADPAAFSYSSGIEKLFSFLLPAEGDELYRYHLSSTMNLLYLHTAWLLGIFMLLVSNVIALLVKIINRIELNIDEKVCCVFIMAGGAILVVYSIIGFMELTLLILAGFLSLNIVLTHRRGKQLIVPVLVILAVVSLAATGERVSNEHYLSQRDFDGFNYLESFSKWYVTTIPINDPTIVHSDVMTNGYLMLSFAKTDFYPLAIKNHVTLTRDEIRYFLGLNKTIISTDFENNYYIINYKLHHFSILGWETFKSWSNYQSTIERLPVDVLYSSNLIGIYA